MTELRTLKDFRCEADNCCDRDKCENQSIKVNSLKAEAVKWIKNIDTNLNEEAKTHVRGELNSKISGLCATREWITHFFNITDEELAK